MGAHTYQYGFQLPLTDAAKLLASQLTNRVAGEGAWHWSRTDDSVLTIVHVIRGFERGQRRSEVATKLLEFLLATLNPTNPKPPESEERCFSLMMYDLGSRN